MLGHMSVQIKYVLTFIKNDLTLVETHAIALYFDLGSNWDLYRSTRKMSDVRLLFHALVYTIVCIDALC